ncbi:MAG: PKD domain-containing protein [Bacteroidota bacterium]|nr:PKD domain-containing protein [Bacteroidota bacterium]
MKRILSFVILVVLSMSACKKDNSTPTNPIAGFTFNGDTSGSLTLGPYDQYSLINTSTNADAFIWDLGNGTTSKDADILLSYPKSGNYTVTLTSINKNGSKSIVSKSVKVVDAVLRQVIIKTLSWNTGSARPAGKANVWVEIVKGASNQNYTALSNGSFDAPVIYKSDIASNIDSGSAPITFNISQPIIIDIPTLTLGHGYKGIGYGFNLYAQDATGIYLLSSTFWSGNNTHYSGSFLNNKFTIGTGISGNVIDFNGDYE